MKSIVRALSITAPLVLLLVQPVSGHRTASAAPITTLDQDTVEWLDTSKAIVKFYKPGDTAAFFIADDDLATVKTGTGTWTTLTSAVGAGCLYDLATGKTETGGCTGLPAGLNTTNQVDYALVASGYSTMSPTKTPLAAAPSVTIDSVSSVVTGFGGSTDATAGNFKLFAGAGAASTVAASFTFDIVDSYPGVNTGTVASTDNRARVTSTSDASGEWVTISEVDALGNSTLSATSKIFRGAVVLSADAAATAPDDGKVWVQDGDTLTVTFYKSDHTTVIDSTTATIDATDPTITDVVPADGSIVSGSSPVVTFTIADGGSGFNTSAPGGAVDLKINGCPVGDTELVFTSLTSSSLDVFFTLPAGSKWSDAATPTCAGRTGGGFGIADATAPDPLPPPGKGTNHHGTPFTWEIVATDGAGNTKTLTGDKLDLTVDNVKPDLIAATTGKGWDADKKKDKTQRDSIKLTYIEGLDPATVETDGSDYIVEGASVTAALLAGVDRTKDVLPGPNEKNTFVYLELAADLAPDARPKVEQTGSVKDQAGNELKPAAGKTVADSIPSAADGIKPTVSDGALSAHLLAKDGESVLTFDADENLTGTGDALGSCTCLAITHAGAGLTSDKGTVSLPTPTSGKYTFKQKTFTTTGIYGLMIQAKDLGANVTKTGHVKVSDEDLSDQFSAPPSQLGR